MAEFLFQRLLDVLLQRVFDVTLESFFDLGRDFGLNGLVEVVPEAGDFDVGVDLSARLLLLLLLAVGLVDGDEHVDLVDAKVGGTDGGLLAGPLDGQRAGPTEVVQREVVTHAVRVVVGLAVERDRDEAHRLGDGLGALGPDAGHVHGHVVLLPAHVEQLAAAARAAGHLALHLGDHGPAAGGRGAGHLGGHGRPDRGQALALHRVVERPGLGAGVGRDGDVGGQEARGPGVLRASSGAGRLERGRHVAADAVHGDRVVPGLGVARVRPERPGGQHAVKVVLGDDGVARRFHVQIVQPAGVQALQRAVLERHVLRPSGQLDRGPVQVHGAVQVRGRSGDVVVPDDLLERGDLLDHLAGEPGRPVHDGHLVLALVPLLFGVVEVVVVVVVVFAVVVFVVVVFVVVVVQLVTVFVVVVVVEVVTVQFLVVLITVFVDLELIVVLLECHRRSLAGVSLLITGPLFV